MKSTRTDIEIENAKQEFRESANKFIAHINRGVHDASFLASEMKKKLVLTKREDGLKWLAEHTKSPTPMMFQEPAVKLSESKFGFFSKIFQKPEPKTAPKPPETKIKKGF